MGRDKLSNKSREMVSLLIVAGLLLAIGMYLFVNKSVNQEWFFAINSLTVNSIIWLILSNMGDGLFVGCLLFILFRRSTAILGKCLVAGVLVHISVRVLKNVIKEYRPGNTEGIASTGNFLGTPLELTNYAMPSGHACTIFMALGIIYLNRDFFESVKARYALILGICCLSILVNISRLAVGAHWPADVFAGSALGIAIACSVNSIKFSSLAAAVIVNAFYIPFALVSILRINSINSIETLISNGVVALFGFIAGCLIVKNFMALKSKLRER